MAYKFKIGKEYNYEFSSIDSEGEDIFLLVDWGDGNHTDWIGPYSSGQKVTVSHTWQEKGDKTISVYAKDVNDLWSEEATMTVQLSRSRFAYDSPLFKLLSRFTQLFPILRLLLQRLG